MNVLCTDKTGTLTEGTIVLADATDSNGRPSATVRQLAFLNAAFETGIDNPIDAAIVSAGTQAGLSTTGHAKIDEIPYDFLRKRLTIVMTEEGDAERHLVVTKGAFMNVLSVCTQVARDGAVYPLTDAIISELSTSYEAKGKAGLRVLALASSVVSAKGAYQRDDEREMVFAGFLLFLDPPKADAARVLDDLAKLNVQVKVITGDNRFVTGHLAATVGLNPTSMLTGEAADEARRRGALACGAHDVTLCRDRSAAEGAHRARAPTHRPLGRLPRGRHQRRPRVARGRRRYLGRPGGGRRTRERRHHPPEARPRRAAHGGGGRAAHVREYAQEHLDYDERELREHGRAWRSRRRCCRSCR